MPAEAPLSKIMDVSLTRSCNYDCSYCNQRQELDHPMFDLSESKRKITSNKRRSGAEWIAGLNHFPFKDDYDKLIFSGGEPSLHADFFDIVTRVRGWRSKLIVTNLSFDVQKLIAACRRLPPVRSIRPHTHATLFGLLACTGMRVSEALHLSVDDVDVDRGVITIVEGKFHKSRVLPLHPSCTEALAAYRELRERRRPATGAFFVTHYGTPLTYSKALITFRGIARRLGWSRDTRIHGLRHTFAVRKLLQWHRDGEDVDRCIGQLSTYLGHCKVHHTYWYLSAVPELMDIAADRFERYAEVRHG